MKDFKPEIINETIEVEKSGEYKIEASEEFINDMKKKLNLSKKEEYLASRIFNFLDRIEDITGKMAHEIPELRDDLKRWQNKELKSSFFNLKVINYFEKIQK